MTPVLDNLTMPDADTVNRRTHPPLPEFVCPVPARTAFRQVSPDSPNGDHLDIELRQ